MPTNTAVVVLNIPREDDGFDAFDDLSGKKKIEIFRKRIEEICTDLLVKNPNDPWIITWREYGITEGSDSRAIPKQTKDEFKKVMAELVAKYPNLHIVAGTVATINLKTHEKAKKHLALYNNNEIEKLSRLENEAGETVGQIEQHKKKFSDTIASKQAEIEVLRNTTYIFSHGKTVMRREKNAPFNEVLEQDKDMKGAVYRVGKKGKSLKPTVTLTTPKGKKFRIGIEKCREHSLQVLKNSKRKKPLIHFVLSDSITLNSDAFYGENVIQSDSVKAPKLIQPDQKTTASSNVILYTTSLLRSEPLKEKQPFVPFECRIISLIDKARSFVSKGSPKAIFLEKFKAEFQDIMISTENQHMVKFLLKKLKNTEFKETFCQESKGILKLFNNNAGITACFKEILELTEQHQKQHKSIYKDIHEKFSPSELRFEEKKGNEQVEGRAQSSDKKNASEQSIVSMETPAPAASSQLKFEEKKELEPPMVSMQIPAPETSSQLKFEETKKDDETKEITQTSDEKKGSEAPTVSMEMTETTPDTTETSTPEEEPRARNFSFR